MKRSNKGAETQIRTLAESVKILELYRKRGSLVIGFYFLLILIVSLLKGRTVINRFIREEVRSGAYKHAVAPPAPRPSPPRAWIHYCPPSEDALQRNCWLPLYVDPWEGLAVYCAFGNSVYWYRTSLSVEVTLSIQVKLTICRESDNDNLIKYMILNILTKKCKPNPSRNLLIIKYNSFKRANTEPQDLLMQNRATLVLRIWYFINKMRLTSSRL